FSDGRIRYLRSDAPDLAAVNATLRELAASAASFLAGGGPGGSASRVEYWAEARYPQQTWEIEVPLAGPELADGAALSQLVADFPAPHPPLSPAPDPASPIEVIAWRVRASRRLGNQASARLAGASAGEAPGRRRVYWRDEGWIEVPLHPFAALDPGAPVARPAIIESPLTTLARPPRTSGCPPAAAPLRLQPPP